ncbi:hypothetical protein H4S04_002487 [Coemansia sp. S16]|nr:hypothetical protein H4S04_002487 [Coemansia sp. S16]
MTLLQAADSHTTVADGIGGPQISASVSSSGLSDKVEKQIVVGSGLDSQIIEMGDTGANDSGGNVAEKGTASGANSLAPSVVASSQGFNKETIEKGRLYVIVAGLCLLFFVSALDTTILATVYIDISNQYDDMTNGIWIITSYLLATTAVQPMYGKFSDILGRFESVVVSTVIFCIGSVMCAASHSMAMLVASRAIQGIGGGGMMTMVSVIMSDVTSERDRGRFSAYLAAAWGVASAVGPVMGGAIVENASWRIIFWINLPVCIPSIIVLYFALRIPRPEGSLREKISRIDFLGLLTFQAFIIPIIIAFAWGGQGYKWTSGRVLGTICGSVAMGILFLFIEWKVAVEPIVPLRLFRIRNVIASGMSHFALGASIYAPLMFIPAWELSVKRSTETQAGLHLLPLMGTMVVGAAAAGACMLRLGRFRELIVTGGFLIAIGNSLLILLDANSNNGQRIGFLAITGAGFGFCVQTMLMGAQCAVAGLDMAIVTTLMLFLRTLGGIFALSVLSSVFNNQLRTAADELGAQYPKYSQLILDTINDQSIIGKSTGLPEGVPLLSDDSTTDDIVDEENRLSGKRLYLALAGLDALLFIAALDLTIIATVYVEIANSFNALSRAEWTVTSYIGLGAGACVQPIMMAAQAAVSGPDMAAVTTLCAFLRSLGGILCVAILSSIMHSVIKDGLTQLAVNHPRYIFTIIQIADNQSIIYRSDVSEELRAMIVAVFMRAMRMAFYALVPFSVMLAILTFAFKHVDLNRNRKKTIQ